MEQMRSLLTGKQFPPTCASHKSKIYAYVTSLKIPIPRILVNYIRQLFLSKGRATGAGGVDVYAAASKGYNGNSLGNHWYSSGIGWIPESIRR